MEPPGCRPPAGLNCRPIPQDDCGAAAGALSSRQAGPSRQRRPTPLQAPRPKQHRTPNADISGPACGSRAARIPRLARLRLFAPIFHVTHCLADAVGAKALQTLLHEALSSDQILTLLLGVDLGRKSRNPGSNSRSRATVRSRSRLPAGWTGRCLAAVWHCNRGTRTRPGPRRPLSN